MMKQADLTLLLAHASEGDENALQQVFAVLYGELGALARRQVNQRGRGDFLDTAELVHESYIRFADAGRIRLEHRQHFLHYAARVMRSVVVDSVRERQAQRRGGGVTRVTLDTGLLSDASDEEVLQVHEALEELQCFDERMVRVVEMRYFAGMTEAEVAEALGVTERTVRRVWQRARLWLAEAMAS